MHAADWRATRAIDRNLFSLFRLAAEKSGKPCRETEHYSATDLRPSPWGSAVFDLRLSAENDARDIADGITRGELPNRVMTGPTTSPPDTPALLTRNGFFKKWEAYGMICDLAADAAGPVPTDYRCRLIKDDGALLAWARIVTANLFCAPSEAAIHFRDVMRAILDEEATFYLGHEHTDPAAAAMTFIDENGVGGYYFVATAEAFRGRGHGLAITRVAMNDLKKKGVQTCILQSTEAGKRVYERAGFTAVNVLGRYALEGGCP